MWTIPATRMKAQREHRTRNVALSLTALGLLALPVHAAGQQEQTEPMGFFVTSVGLGNGGNLGGLEGADAHCQSLAERVGAGNRTWRAYLSTQATADATAVNARDRILSTPVRHSWELIREQSPVS